MKHVLIPLFFACAFPAFGQAACPPAPNHDLRQADIISALQRAPNARTAQHLTAQLWEIWLAAPDEIAQGMLDQGMRMRASGDYLGAKRALDRLVEYCPAYAEGYNQRAFVAFLSGDYPAAIADIDSVLKIVSWHLGALSGKALTLIEMGMAEEAQVVLREAVRLNPWMAERALLDEPIGTDI